MATASSFDLAGLAEVADALGLTKSAAYKRTRRGDFPSPVCILASGPIWDRSDVVAYAKSRSSKFVERQGVQELAGERDELSLEEVAGILHTTVDELHRLSREHAMPGRYVSLRLTSIRRSDLGLWGRALGAQPVELAGKWT